VLASARIRAAMLPIVALGWLALASPAPASPPSPPFTQCPAAGFDTSCATLIVINQQGGLESYVDPSQEKLDGGSEELVGVQNESAATVTSMSLKGNDIFGFDADGLCSGVNQSGNAGFRAPPGGCPFGSTGYEGPNTSFSAYTAPDPGLNANEGTVNFLNGTVESGHSAYFSLEDRPEVTCQDTTCEPIALTTHLIGGSQSGTAITVASGTAVTDTTSMSGANAGIAGGAANYYVYSDPKCEHLADEAGQVTVTNGTVPGSEAKTYAPGTYYWQVVYSGDAHNATSVSTCGSTVETVTCGRVQGQGKNAKHAPRESVTDNLNTSLTGAQTFAFVHAGIHKVKLTRLTSASCTINGGEMQFTGRGPGSIGKVKNYEVSFTFTTRASESLLAVKLEQAGHLVRAFPAAPLAHSTEQIS
jgi:hypothetical protein